MFQLSKKRSCFLRGKLGRKEVGDAYSVPFLPATFMLAAIKKLCQGIADRAAAK
jgi:hypothetical protein